MYIKVKLLEGPEYVITSNVNGFYINDSVEGGHFNPAETTKVNPCHSHSLVGLLYQISPKFRQNMEDHLNNIIKAEPLFLTKPVHPRYNWLLKVENSLPNPKSLFTMKDEADPLLMRDWNEEF